MSYYVRKYNVKFPIEQKVVLSLLVNIDYKTLIKLVFQSC